jgi:hypothetical protein
MNCINDRRVPLLGTSSVECRPTPGTACSKQWHTIACFRGAANNADTGQKAKENVQ